VAEHLTDRARRRGLITPEPDPEALARDPEAARGLSDRQRGDLLRRLIDRAEPGVLSHRHHAMCRCNFTERLGHSLAVAHLSAMVDRSMLAEEEAGESEAPTAFEIDGVPADLVADNIIALVAHEVGHVLGLRHNFAGSAWMSASAIDEYTDRAQEPPATSVMDYIGTFIAEPGKPQGVYNTVRVGAYDRWAIAYGYMHADEDELAEHLAMSVMPEHRYMTDEDVYSPDPTAMRYDFGSDPVEGRQRQFRRIDFLRQQLLDRLATENENWTKVTAAFNTLRFEEMMALWDTTGWIGGTYLSRDFNTPGAARPRRNVEPEIQRGVLDMIVQRLFSEDSLPIDRDLANSLQTVTWYDSTFPSFGGGPTDVDLLGNANMTQYFVLSDLMHLCTPRLANQELRTEPGANALTVPELHRTLTDSIWSEFTREPTQGSAYTNLNPKVSALRRGLQREHANQLIDLAYRMEFMPATMLSAQLVAIDQLRTIRDRLAAWTNDGELARSAGPLDDYTRIHITELLRMIDATLEAQVSRSP
ncbi:MAG: zinc-dependent metalloprotease, partial [Phycisphaerales bacterium]